MSFTLTAPRCSESLRQSAMASVEEVASDTAVAVVEAILPDLADAGALKSAVQNRLGG